MKKRILFEVMFGIMFFILGVIIAIQYKTVKESNTFIGTTENSSLKTEVLKWKEKYEQKYEELENKEEKLEEQKKIITERDSESNDLQKELIKLNSLIGTIDVKGNGVILVLEDNKNVTRENIGILENISDYIIHDSDLLTIVNVLKNAGAEAISINDERVINSTSIECDGSVILINNNKISSPFTIKAIGSQETIMGALRIPGGFVETLQAYGLVSSIKKQNNITIYKYSGVIY